MKKLVISQSSGNIYRMIHRMIERKFPVKLKDVFSEIKTITENKLWYEFVQKGTYTLCILTIDNEIVGIGMTMRDRKDKYNPRVAEDVSAHKAIEDWMYGIEPEK